MGSLCVPAPPISADDVRAHTRQPWPLPAGGDTRARWSALEALAQHDLPLAKLVEPHHDAIAILADLDSAPAASDDVWAVWAAEPPFAVLTAEERSGHWTVSGRKAFCSGADVASHALVTAQTPAGSRLVAVDLASHGVTVDADDHPWAGPGMARAGTVTLAFAGVPAEPVGEPGAYTDRPGFWWGAIGIAAIWLGGARGVAQPLEQAVGRLDAHGLAHLGAVRAELDSLGLVLDAAASLADEGRLDAAEVERLALVVRDRASAVVDSVVTRVGRALGPAPLAFDAAHAARVVDLQVFVRQHHAERDQARLGSWGDADA
jgi:alkylation response protein AidB-like acyl-CoA dehydrogenase